MTRQRRGFVQRRLGESWYLNARTAIAPPVKFVPSPEMTDTEIDAFAAPEGTARLGWQLLYLGCWVVQLIAAAGALVSLGVLVASVLGGAQSTVQGCQAGIADCTSSTAADVVGPVLWFVGCSAAVALGRPLRREIAAIMQTAALRAARAARAAMQTRTVLVESLSPRNRWLLNSADRLLENYPSDLANRVMWDIARRIDAATALHALITPKNRADSSPVYAATQHLTERLTAQAERDVAALRAAVRDSATYRHEPCRTSSLSALPRSRDADTMLTDAELLLPKPGRELHSVPGRKGATR